MNAGVSGGMSAGVIGAMNAAVIADRAPLRGYRLTPTKPVRGPLDLILVAGSDISGARGVTLWMAP
jgi:hypothetical protein